MSIFNKKFHYIYMITNKITDKYYIGIHSTDNLNDNYFGSGVYLWASINYHGKENFDMEFLQFYNSREELVKVEEETITMKEISNGDCYNIRPGGRKVENNPESNRKVSEKKKGWVPCKDKNGNTCYITKEQFSEGSHVGISSGYKFTKEQKDNLSKLRTGIGMYRLDTGEVIRIPVGEFDKYIHTPIQLGCKQSKDNQWKGQTKFDNEAIAKMADTLSGRTKETHEGPRKQSEAMKGRTKENYKYLADNSERLLGKQKKIL